MHSNHTETLPISMVRSSAESCSLKLLIGAARNAWPVPDSNPIISPFSELLIGQGLCHACGKMLPPEFNMYLASIFFFHSSEYLFAALVHPDKVSTRCARVCHRI
jgi:hypothetical protein